MLHLFRMTQSGRNSNGQICSKDYKEDQSNDKNKVSKISADAASDQKELRSPEEQGDDGTTDTRDPLLRCRIFRSSGISMPSSIYTAPRIDSGAIDVDLHQPRQSATVHGQVTEDPN